MALSKQYNVVLWHLHEMTAPDMLGGTDRWYFWQHDLSKPDALLKFAWSFPPLKDSTPADTLLTVTKIQHSM